MQTSPAPTRWRSTSGTCRRAVARHPPPVDASNDRHAPGAERYPPAEDVSRNRLDTALSSVRASEVSSRIVTHLAACDACRLETFAGTVTGREPVRATRTYLLRVPANGLQPADIARLLRVLGETLRHPCAAAPRRVPGNALQPAVVARSLRVRAVDRRHLSIDVEPLINAPPRGCCGKPDCERIGRGRIKTRDKHVGLRARRSSALPLRDVGASRRTAS